MTLVREEKPGDEAEIRRVNEQAFGQPDEANLVDALRRRRASTLSLVAVEDNRIVGHILFTPVTIESRGESESTSAIALGPMAVLPEYQNLGIGSQLVKNGLRMCGEAGHQLLFVLGHPNYYPRFGFKPASSIGVGCQFDVPDEVFMVKELGESSTSRLGGVVEYQPEFGTM